MFKSYHVVHEVSLTTKEWLTCLIKSFLSKIQAKNKCLTSFLKTFSVK